jgi:hypothetical protein
MHKIYKHLLLQDPPKSTQICIFGLKIYHLANLDRIASIFTRTKSYKTLQVLII